MNFLRADKYKRLEEIATTVHNNSAEELREEKAKFERQKHQLQRDNERLRAQISHLQTLATLEMMD